MGLFNRKPKELWYTISYKSFMHGARAEIISDGSGFRQYEKYIGRVGRIVGRSGIDFIIDLGGMTLEVNYEDVSLAESSLPIDSACEIVDEVKWG